MKRKAEGREGCRERVGKGSGEEEKGRKWGRKG